MAKSARKIEFYFSACRWNLDIEGTCEGTFQPGSPAVMYLRNGDPGYPADPAEFEPEEITITDIGGQKLAEPIVLDAKGQAQFTDEFGDFLYQCAVDAVEEQKP
jgi:hypothetical protein